MIAATCKYTSGVTGWLQVWYLLSEHFIALEKASLKDSRETKKRFLLEEEMAFPEHPLSCRSSKGMKEVRTKEGRSWSATENDSEYWLRNQFQDECWSICSWDFNGVSISALWQQPRYPFIQSGSPYWSVLSGTRSWETQRWTRHITVLLAFTVNWRLTI